jgi:hypothetical protein
MNHWGETLSAEQLEARYALTASLDPVFARDDRQYWESRTASQLRTLAAGAWCANQGEQYQMARTYLAVLL